MRYLEQVAVLLATGLFTASAAAASLVDYVAKIELALASRPESTLPFTFSPTAKSPGEAGTLNLMLGADAAAAFVESPDALYVLHVHPRNASHEISVRERAVIYINLSDDGPHWPVYATERRGPWRDAGQSGSHQFKVGGLPEPLLRLDRRRLLDAVSRSDFGKDARWLEVARRCVGPGEGPCYTVTDSEYEISVAQHGRVLARGIVRVRQPDGC